MTRRRDPVQARADGSHDLYDVATWEARSRLDRISVRLHRWLNLTLRAVVILAAVLIFVSQFALGGFGAVTDPTVTALVVLSALPALGLAWYVHREDATSGEPLELLVATFILGVLFAGFAGILNTVVGSSVQAIGSGFGTAPLIGLILMFYLVVGPVEEVVKWLAIRLYAYRSDRFDAVIDGAVYGAVAGLGFATIENALYITQNLNAVMLGSGNIVGAGSGITAVRALAGPGHVIYSAFAGYYLGLAKFNPENRGPIVVKGLLIAAVIHGTYNTLVSTVPDIVVALVPGISPFTVFLGFVIVFDGIFGYILLRKIRRYSRTYKELHHGKDASEFEVAKTEYDA
ncbi:MULTISPECIES: PrsW family intramembrane metalloprotease [unclassified Haladaptatus]|uniref:PrsW family intramembrane metalloprotease n=1 Tax=unclassified Haladaptatus TaxID=2622732 RepID=UPI0023E757DC|nr:MULTISPECIES: PrsW family glutamic-type intramembrane protease [unclassified Haladaptatus]